MGFREPNIYTDSKHPTVYLLNTVNKLSFTNSETNWYCVTSDVTEKYTTLSVQFSCQNVLTLIIRKKSRQIQDKGYSAEQLTWTQKMPVL